jgi:aminoglycoside 2''-phosphotransferase
MEREEHTSVAGLALYTSLIRRHFPAVELRSVRSITRGWDSVVLEVNGEFMFRFPRRDEVQVALMREIHLLPLLAPTLATPVPHFRFIARDITFVGYPKLNGMACEDEGLSAGQAISLLPALARFLGELHRFPRAQARQTGVIEYTPQRWRERYHQRYLDVQTRVFPLLAGDLAQRSAQLWEDFLHDSAGVAFQSVLIHGDLAGEHILCDPGRAVLTGVIDWGDVAIGDPALDFAGLYSLFGRGFVEQMLRRYQGQEERAFWRRLDFYRCILPFAWLLFGVDERCEAAIQRGLAGLRSLFRT